MALADYQPERSTISHKDKPLISVRGLNFEDTTVLVRRHLPALQRLFEIYGSRKLLPKEGEAEPAIEDVLHQIESIIFDLLVSSPDTAAQMIVLASDEPGATEAAKRLSMPLQLKILFEIVRLTFEDVGGPLAFGAMVRRILSMELTDSPETKP